MADSLQSGDHYQAERADRNSTGIAGPRWGFTFRFPTHSARLIIRSIRMTVSVAAILVEAVGINEIRPGRTAGNLQQYVRCGRCPMTVRPVMVSYQADDGRGAGQFANVGTLSNGA